MVSFLSADLSANFVLPPHLFVDQILNVFAGKFACNTNSQVIEKILKKKRHHSTWHLREKDIQTWLVG